MKKFWWLVAVILAVALSFVVRSENNNNLMCDENGDFVILVVSDPQCDTKVQWHEARDELETLVKRSSPDFVLINGDMNSYNKIPYDMWDLFVSPLESRGIYWSTTNGNHDPFNHKNYNMYKSYKYCLNDVVSAKDINYESARPMNYVLPVYSNDGECVVFAIYGMDSGSSNKSGYEGITVKQINWYIEQSRQLTMKNGGNVVTSILCMHIPLPQMLEMYYGGECNIYGVANEIKFNTTGYSTQNGKKIDKINVHTSTPAQDNKMFDAILNQGDIKAVIFGHNHRNNFIGSYKGVLLGFAGKISTGCYSDTVCRGGRVIRLNQKEPQNFTVEWLGSISGAADQPTILSDGTRSK